MLDVFLNFILHFRHKHNIKRINSQSKNVKRKFIRKFKREFKKEIEKEFKKINLLILSFITLPPPKEITQFFFESNFKQTFSSNSLKYFSPFFLNIKLIYYASSYYNNY